jgi:hypothetical protein
MSTKQPLSFLLCIVLTACGATAPPAPTETATPAKTATITSSATNPPTETPLPTLTSTPLPTDTVTPSPVPVIESLDATVNVNLLSCRYGPGADYLYLDGLREGLKLKLIGQTGGNNWVWVEGTKNNCWVNIKFIIIDGDFKTLPIVYPDPARLPITPYYPPTTVLSATRDGNTVTVTWLAVPISPGDYEKDDMFNYIVEVWRCEGGQFIFDPLPTNWSTISFVDEPGCSQSSHGRVFVQEKHGFAGPAEIPWP